MAYDRKPEDGDRPLAVIFHVRSLDFERSDIQIIDLDRRQRQNAMKTEDR